MGDFLFTHIFITMNLQEQIQRIREMMNLLIEEEDDYTHTDNLLDVSQKITDLLGGWI